MSMNERTILLIGEAAFSRLNSSRVAVAGLGGVGGHCAEALARAGVGSLHLIDYDTVSESNLNRQLVATRRTLGMQKTEAMRARLEEVSACRVSCYDGRITADSIEEALPEALDYIVDAIDDARGKLALIQWAHTHGVRIVSCLGAGNRRDATQFSVQDIFDTAGDPLARKMRGLLRRAGIASLDVVFSSEAPQTAPGQTTVGSLAPVTAAAGLAAASWVLSNLTGDYPSHR